MKVDKGEVVALDIAYASFAARYAFYREAFINAFASMLAYEPYSVTIINYQASSANSTLVYFDIVLSTLSDYDVIATVATVKTLFNLSAVPCAATTPVGCPAIPAFAEALQTNGLPIVGAYYNDQFPTQYPLVVTPPPPALNASQVGSWQFTDGNEVLALDILYESYANREQYFRDAVVAGVADALGVAYDAVYVNDFQASAVSTTLVYVDVDLPAPTSSAIPAMFSQVALLFTQCRGPNVLPAGCPAGVNSSLVTKLRQYGLPLTNAYYNQQYPSPPPPPP